MNLFLYGTLRHQPLLETVLGATPANDRLRPATLTGAEVTYAAGESYPMIRLGRPGKQAEGLLFSPPDDTARARIDFYEGGFGYLPRQVETSEGPAEVYVPESQDGSAGEPFDLAAWAARDGPLAVEAAGEVMRHYGRREAREVARIFHSIRLRAAARLRARARGDAARYDLTIDSRTLSYADFFAVEDMSIRIEDFEGGQIGPLRRGVFVGMDAAIVLPYDPVRDRVLLVEQQRMGPLARGEADAWMMEPVAGHVDPGETPEEAARREAREEAGLELDQLELIAEAYASPGNSTEYYYVFAALADLPDDLAGIGGEPEEGENIRSHLLSFDTFLAAMRDCRIRVAPLLLAGYWLALNRDGLRTPGTSAGA